MSGVCSRRATKSIGLLSIGALLLAFGGTLTGCGDQGRTVHAWAVAEMMDLTGIILRSDDGGRRWSVAFTESPRPPLVPSQLWAVDFVEQETGWVVGDSELLKTVDGGRTWTSQFQSNPSFVDDSTFQRVAFVDSNRGILAGRADYLVHPPHPGPGAPLLLFYTRDGGEHWRPASVEPSGGTVTPSICLFPNGVALRADSCEVLRSENFGESWSRISTQPDLATTCSDRIACLDSGAVWLVGTSLNALGVPVMLHSDDYGRTWQDESDRSPAMIAPGIDDLLFLSPMLGWTAAEGIPPSYQPLLLHTADGGRPWIISPLPQEPLAMGAGSVRSHSPAAMASP